jgi:uncharacterized protein YjiS (DUF1127 family)
MSLTFVTIASPDVTKRPAAFAKALNEALSACCYGIVRYYACRAAIKSLHEFDDRALWDIGLQRCQIEAAVHGFITAPERGRM